MHFYAIAALLLVVLAPLDALASCPVCFGETESGSEVGLNAAVWVMVGVTGMVLSLFSALFFRVRRRIRMTMSRSFDQSAEN